MINHYYHNIISRTILCERARVCGEFTTSDVISHILVSIIFLSSYLSTVRLPFVFRFLASFTEYVFTFLVPCFDIETIILYLLWVTSAHANTSVWS